MTRNASPSRTEADVVQKNIVRALSKPVGKDLTRLAGAFADASRYVSHISPARRSGTPWLALERPSWLPCLRTRAERVREGVIAGPATLKRSVSSSASFPVLGQTFLVKNLAFVWAASL